MIHANLFRRVLSFLLDLLILGGLLALTAIVWMPAAMFAAAALGSRWDWAGWGLGMVGVFVAAVLVVTAAYLVGGVTRGGTWGQRLVGLAVVGRDGMAPTISRALTRYLMGFLVPLALPLLVSVVAATSWEARHAARKPSLEIPAGQLTVPVEAALADRQWEEAGRRARRWLELLPWVLYAGELGLMAAWVMIHPERRGWHDQAAGTLVVVRERASTPP